MNFINFLYILLFLISLYFLVNTSYTIYEEWLPKAVVLYFAVFIYILSIFITNKFINKYVCPVLLFLNIAILICVTFNNKFKKINYFALIGIIYILYIFDYKDFELKNGLLINPNKEWIYLHICILIIFYLLSTYIHIYGKISLSLLVCYPLLFPINEYFKHRIISLFFVTSLWTYLLDKKIVKI